MDAEAKASFVLWFANLNIKTNLTSMFVKRYLSHKLFSRDVTAAMLVYLNNGTAAMLQSNPQGPVVQKVDSAIHWIHRYCLVNSIGFDNVHPLDSDLSVG